MLEMEFLCRFNLLENTMDVGFLCTTVYCLENWKKNYSLHVLFSCLNNMLFLERNADIGMHAILDTMQFLM